MTPLERELYEALSYAYRKLHNFVVVHGDDVFGEAWETGGSRILEVLQKASKQETK
jgi:hypothetical protein